jgi:hypothetical protein
MFIETLLTIAEKLKMLMMPGLEYRTNIISFFLLCCGVPLPHVFGKNQLLLYELGLLVSYEMADCSGHISVLSSFFKRMDVLISTTEFYRLIMNTNNLHDYSVPSIFCSTFAKVD